MLTSLSLNLKQFENGKKIPTRVFELLNFFQGFLRDFHGISWSFKQEIFMGFQGIFQKLFLSS